jgi:hypothetical protein
MREVTQISTFASIRVTSRIILNDAANTLGKRTDRQGFQICLSRRVDRLDHNLAQHLGRQLNTGLLQRPHQRGHPRGLDLRLGLAGQLDTSCVALGLHALEQRVVLAHRGRVEA